MRHFGLRFEEERIALRESKTHERIDRIVPGAKLPILIDGKIRIWESMAILEYLAERTPRHRWYPAARAERALARAVSNEMHAGFQALRSSCPMNCFAKAMKRVPEEALKDIRRIEFIWESLLVGRKPGGFLFGAFGIADAMYAPVAVRLKTYGIPVRGRSAAYMERFLKLPAMREWFEAAAQETERIADYEVRR